MPIIKSAKKRMIQNSKRRARRYPIRSKVKTVFKNALMLIKDGNTAELKKTLPHVYSVLDTACKKNILHPNNVARKKSRLAMALNDLEKGGNKPAAAKKEEKAEKEEA